MAGGITRAGAGWTVAAIAGIGACLVAAVVPPDSTTWAALILPAELAATVLLLLMALRMPPGARRIWLLLWGYQVLTIAGDVVYTVQSNLLGVEAFPGPADPLYLSGYVALIVALVLLVRTSHPGRDREAWIDTAIMAGAAIAVVGAFVILPLLEQSETPSADTLLAVTYPVADLVALSALLRVLVGRPRRLVSLVVLGVALGLTLVADFVYNILVIHGLEEAAPGWLEAGFIAALLLLTAAAAVPDAGHVATPVKPGEARISGARIFGLSVGVLTAPVLLAVVAWGTGGSTARLLAVASIVVMALVLWRVILLLETVAAQTRLLSEQARTDPLTGLPNRRTWDFELDRAEAADPLAPLTVAMLDLDRFKDYNDRHGHLAGDELLAACATSWRAQLPPTAFLARYGGEEFALLLPSVDDDSCERILQRLQSATPGQQTVSVGYARRRPGEPIRQAVASADRALYAAKDAGRDCVIRAGTQAPA